MVKKIIYSKEYCYQREVKYNHLVASPPKTTLDYTRLSKTVLSTTKKLELSREYANIYLNTVKKICEHYFDTEGQRNRV